MVRSQQARVREAARIATEARVLRAAEKLFVTRGYSAASVRAIAESAGVSVGTVMGVGDKPALLVRVFDGLVLARLRRIDGADAAALADSKGLVDRLLACVRPFVELFASHERLARSYLSILVSGAHSSALLTGLSERLIRLLIAELRSGGIRTPELTARALVNAYSGVLFARVAAPAATGGAADAASSDTGGTAAVEAELRQTFSVILGAETRRGMGP